MKKLTFLLLAGLITFQAFSQESYIQEITDYQNELNREFKNPEESPLSTKQLKKFKEHKFFPIDSTYRVKAKFIRHANPITFQIKTTTNRLPEYDKFATLEFELNGEIRTLTVYQSHRLRAMERTRNYLFLPFTDLTNGNETYEGGRYIDFQIPDGNEIILDFNKAYNPYCVYGPQYSCPIPPEENHLEIRIEAGIMMDEI